MKRIISMIADSLKDRIHTSKFHTEIQGIEYTYNCYDNVYHTDVKPA